MLERGAVSEMQAVINLMEVQPVIKPNKVDVKQNKKQRKEKKRTTITQHELRLK